MTLFSISHDLTVAPPVQRRQPVIALVGGPVALVAAPVALGLALQVNFGQYALPALCWLTISLFACASAYRRLGSNAIPQENGSKTSAIVPALVVGLAIQFLAILSTYPVASVVIRYSGELQRLEWFRRGAIVAAGFAALALLPVAARSQRVQRLALGGMLSAYVFMGLVTLAIAPPPPVDVCIFQREACNAILRGHNPYAMTFAVPYDDPARIYGPGTFENGRLLFGYPYPPLSLLLILPGYLLGDFRLAHLAAMTLAAALIGLSRPGRIATAAAALLLFTPRGFFLLEAGWTEPLAILMLAATMFATQRTKGMSPVYFGLLLAVKQYLILAAPLAWVLNKGLRSRWPISLAVAAGVSLPMIAWNIPAFMHSVVWLQFQQPMRMDALSYLSGLAHAGIYLPTWLAFLAAGGVIAIIVRRPKQSPAALPAAIALVFMVFFALNKQAFCNYYMLVLAAMCCTIALTDEGEIIDRCGAESASRI